MVAINNSVPVTVSSSGSWSFSDNTTISGPITLSSSNGVSTTVSADGNGNIRIGGSIDGGNLYTTHTFSKPSLDEKIKEFLAGKYTRKYIETYLDFMVMNAMLDNLEYLEYKVSLDKELPQ